MIVYFKDFLLNTFIVFSPLVLYPFIYQTKDRPWLYRFLVGCMFSFAIVVTMSFPLMIKGVTYDFRSIPLTVGCLYGGPLNSVILYVIVICYRYVLGQPLNLLYALALLPSLAIVALLWKKYQTSKPYQKIIIAVFLCTSIKLITFGVYLSVTNKVGLLLNSVPETIVSYAIQGLLVGIFVFCMEFLMRYYHLQEEMVRSEKAKIVSEMAAAVAHEIRNPLTTVRGFIQLLGADGISAEKRGFYQKISLEELDRAQMIITDYLSLAKPDPETVELIQIQDEIRYFSNVLLTYANYNNTQIETNIDSEENMQIVGDRHKFRQALINIGKNAIEALQDGGSLTISAKKREGMVVIEIRDTGVGMTEEQIQRLGTPYYSTKEKGTGLGTMVSFTIIKKMNGTITIKSKPGKGTLFCIQFPHAYAAAGSMEEVAAGKEQQLVHKN
ncbi:ATP-binding protein [Brevibacillus fluminis]|uniref:ATP-binding protein n=1 Tax=Brevibacillus fluminis TaxID=511487 RepID=UPI003F8C433C